MVYIVLMNDWNERAHSRAINQAVLLSLVRTSH